MQTIKTFCIVLLNMIAAFLEIALFIVGCVLMYSYQLYALGIIAILISISAGITQIIRIIDIWG